MTARLVAGLLLGLAALSSTTPARAQAKGKRYALLVGVTKYDHAGFSELKYTENDAEELARLLVGSGAYAEVVVLTSARGKKDAARKPTAANIRKELKRLSDKVKRDDLLLVGLAGHGVQIEVKVGNRKRDESFFCPADARPRGEQALAELKKTMIPLLEMFTTLEESGAGVRLMLVDACRNEVRGERRNIDSDNLPKPSRGTAALFSCKGGESAFETKKLGKGHGVFFYHVIQALKGGAKNDRGDIVWSRLVDHVTEKVMADVPALMGDDARQTPQEIRNIVGGSPVLLRASGTARAKAARDRTAEEWYEKGDDYLQGRGGKADLAEARKWYLKAAEREHPPAMRKLGQLYEFGTGVKADLAEAVRWYRKAAEKDDTEGAVYLGWMLANGRGTRKDDTEAVKWYRKAAEKEHPRAMTLLGSHLGHGLGVERDHEEAGKWYHKAAAKGELMAMNNLGWMYENGKGVEQDDAEAVRWYRKAAEGGDPEGMTSLGWMYGNGRGVAVDYDETLKWYRKAAQKGHPRALFNLGVCYETGLGVKKDVTEALKWYRKAAETGYEQAKRKLQELE